jgi:phospholipid/cholesterol/gamma-HCH transport system substrate-binding protein
MKTFSERSPLIIGVVGITAVVVVALAALNYQKLPFLNQGNTYSAEFADAGGLFTGASVEVSGFPSGKVSSIELHGSRVYATFWVDKDIHVGDRSEARIRAKSLLGTKVLEVLPRGDDTLVDTIPIDRTTSPYQLPDALGDLATTIGGLNTAQLSESLATLAQTFSDTPEELRVAVEGVARFSQTLNERDANLRKLLDNAAKATGVLAKRTDQVVSLVRDTNALLAELRTQGDALDQIWYNVSAAAQQLKGFIEENRQELRPALDKLNGVLAIVDNRKERVQLAIKGLNTYAMSLGESIGSGPFFKAYVVNLLPGQFVQPFIDAAFSDLGLDPATLPPSELTDPPTGQPGTPPLPVPYPRTGQGGEPHLTLPDAITGNPGDQGCGPPGLPLPGPTGCYPYREPLPAPPPGGPPPGPPAPSPPELQSTPEPTPSPVYVPAPGEAPHIPGGQP